MTRLLRRLVKWFYLLIAMMLILLAVLVQSGRSFSYLLGDYQTAITEYLSNRLEAKVTIKKIEADWKGLRPGIQLQGVSLQSIDGEPIADVDRAMLRLDILRSLTNMSLVWSDLSVEKVNIVFQQQENGFWKILGLKNLQHAVDNPENKIAKSKIDPLIDMLLLSHHMAIKKSRMSFHFVNGQKLTLNSPNLLLENKADFHRLSLQVDIENKPRSLFLVLEAVGDPRHPDKLNARGYVELNQFPTSEPLQAAMAFLLSGQESYLQSEGEVSSTIWMETRQDKTGFDLSGKVNLQRLLVNVNDRHIALDKFSTDLTGYWQRDGKWRLGLQAVNATLANENIQNMNLLASSAGFKQALQLRLDQLDIEKTHQLLDSAGVLGNEKLQQTLHTLQPKGMLTNVQIVLPYQQTKNWQMAANAKQLSASPWLGVPGLTGIDGYLEANAKGGFISIDSRNGFSMHYASVYDAPMVYDRMFGQVAWHLQKDNNKIYVNSGALNFYQGDERTSGYMWLSAPWYKNTDNTDLVLQVGSKSLNASLYKKYTPSALAPKLLEWLEQSIGDHNSGNANNIGFVFRSTLNNKDPSARSYQLVMDLENTELLYHPEWPQLKKISGQLKLDDANIFANIQTAQIFDTQIRNATIEMHPKIDRVGSLLSVKANLDGSASDGLRILREGALRRYLGNSMDSWYMFGNIQTQLDLIVPLGTQDAAQDAYQQVDIMLHAPSFEMQNLNLQLTDVKGRIRYNSKKGLMSDNLQAVLFNQSVKAELRTIHEAEQRKTRVDLAGVVAINDLAKWTQRPEVLFLKGLLPYKMSVELNHNNKTSDSDSAANGVLQSSSDFIKDAFAEIKLVSDLKGVVVDLPKPYGKKAKEKRAFAFNLWMQPNYSQIQARYDGKLDSLFRIHRGKESRLLNANVALSQEAKFLSDDGVQASEFLVSGYLSAFDMDAWKKTQLQYNQYREQFNINADAPINNNPNEIAGLPFKADLTLGRYKIASAEFENLTVMATRNAEGWNLHLQNPKITGELFLPHTADSPLDINLQQLYVQSTKAKENGVNKEESSPIIDPRSLPFANIKIGQLYIDGEHWGNISFEMKSDAQGASINNIRGNIRGMDLHHHNEADRGAQLFWRVTESGNESHFVGKFTTKNMADVLRNWKKPEMVDSQSAIMLVDVNWLSAPQDFNLVDIAGVIQLKLVEGRFHRDATAGDGLLRLMSILNFDSLARRLRLDFTDLYKTGLAYDEISGKVSFNRGTMSFIDPLVVRSPSSDLQMAGSLNLREETVNARIVANLPVAGNLTFYAALATGLPAAAGVYLVSKLFKKQVSQVASVSYTMKGSWEKPKMKFDRLFESEDSLRESVKEKDTNMESQNPNTHGILESNPDLQLQ